MSEQHKSLPADLLDADVFWQRLVAIYGDLTAGQIVEQLGHERPLSYWVNPLAGGFDVIGTPVPGMPDMYTVAVDADLPQNPAASSGEIYIQNPSSRLAAQILNPQPDEEVLDLAAAPGGKTIAMAAMMNNSGRIAAVEPIKGRFHRLRANVMRCGVTNVAFYMRDGRGVGRAVGERFDRVLLDAPCSSESRMRWYSPGSYQHWSLRKVKEAQRKQRSLLRSAYAALKPGGILVYSTCSFNVEENEAVISHLLKRSDAQLQTIDHDLANACPGLTAWQGKKLPDDLAKTLRILPQGPWDGFYIARMTKPIQAD